MQGGVIALQFCTKKNANPTLDCIFKICKRTSDTKMSNCSICQIVQFSAQNCSIKCQMSEQSNLITGFLCLDLNIHQTKYKKYLLCLLNSFCNSGKIISNIIFPFFIGSKDAKYILVFRHAAILHLLVTVRDLLLTCNLNTALGNFYKDMQSYVGLLKYSILRLPQFGRWKIHLYFLQMLLSGYMQ